MDWQSTFEQAFNVFTNWALVAGTYYVAKFSVTFSLRNKETFATTKDKIARYVSCVAIGLFLSLMFGFNLGRHTENEDGIGPGETVIDFEPTDKERWEHSLKSLLILLPASLVGVYVAFKSDEELTTQQRKERNKELNKPPRDNC